MNLKTSFLKATLAAIITIACSHSFAFDFGSMMLKTTSHAALSKGKKLSEELSAKPSSTVQAAGTIEVAFSPNEGAEALVIKVINSAHNEIRMLSYSFTSAPVTQALLNAKHRGVDIKLVADFESNVEMDKKGKYKSPKSIAALSALSTAGVDVRTIKVYAIHHDKVIIVDGVTTELGSFNYSAAAANRNSENVLVNWNNPALSKVYLDHFHRNYQQSKTYETRY